MDALKNENCDIMTLSSNTKIGLTFGQIISLVIVIFTFSMSYASLNSRIADIESRIRQQETISEKQNESSQKIKDDMSTIKESLIRIEGKLDLKADKQWQK